MLLENILFEGIHVMRKNRKNIIAHISNIEELKDFTNQIKKKMHMTCIFKPSKDELYIKKILGQKVTLHVTAIGILKNKNNEITNIGLKINDIDGLSRNKIAHVTVVVANNGKAVDTAKCDWLWPIEFDMEGKFAVFDKDSNEDYKIETKEKE